MTLLCLPSELLINQLLRQLPQPLRLGTRNRTRQSPITDLAISHKSAIILLPIPLLARSQFRIQRSNQTGSSANLSALESPTAIEKSLNSASSVCVKAASELAGDDSGMDGDTEDPVLLVEFVG